MRSTAATRPCGASWRTAAPPMRWPSRVPSRWGRPPRRGHRRPVGRRRAGRAVGGLQRRPRCQGPPAVRLGTGRAGRAGGAGDGSLAAGAPLARLVPAHHPGVVGPCLPGRYPHHGRHWRRRKGGRGGLTSQLGLLPLTVPEVRRLLVALVWTSPVPPGFVLAWSRWRRRHQARARRAHDQRREQQVRLEY